MKNTETFTVKSTLVTQEKKEKPYKKGIHTDESSINIHVTNEYGIREIKLYDHSGYRLGMIQIPIEYWPAFKDMVDRGILRLEQLEAV